MAASTTTGAAAGPGQAWKLLGVERGGRGVDLTEQIRELAEPDCSLLRPLAERGIEPDGVVVRVGRG